MINILVVEDDSKLNQLVCKYLNGSGYNVKGCLNPQEAYDLMFNAQYDLIISDIMMPGIDGFEFVETVRGLDNRISRDFNLEPVFYQIIGKGFPLISSIENQRLHFPNSLNINRLNDRFLSKRKYKVV